MATGTTRGVIYVHSAAPALCPHLEWAVAGVLGVRVDLAWTPQPAAPGALRAELSWRGDRGTGARLASALLACRLARFEVTEDAVAAAEGERFSYTPSLGLFRAATGEHGDIVVSEHQLRGALARSAAGSAAGSGADGVAAAIETMLGVPWDAELEPFRHAGEGAPVRWLHQVG